MKKLSILSAIICAVLCVVFNLNAVVPVSAVSGVTELASAAYDKLKEDHPVDVSLTRKLDFSLKPGEPGWETVGMLKIMSTVSADWEADEPEIRDFYLEQENTKSTYGMPFLSEKTISYNVSEDGAVIVYLGTADAPYAEPEWTKLGSEEAGSSETYKKQLDAVEYVVSSVGKSLKKMIEKPDRYTVSAEPVEFNGRQCTEVTGKDESFLLFDMDSIQAAFEAVAYRSAAYFDAETGDPVKAVFDLSGCYDNPEVLPHTKEITFLGFDTVTEIEIPEQVLAEAVSVSD